MTPLFTVWEGAGCSRIFVSPFFRNLNLNIMGTEMQHLNNGFFSCPRCGVQRRYTQSVTGFMYNMGKQHNIRMTCPCEEREFEAERKARPERYIVQKLITGWYDLIDRQTGKAINDKPLTEPEALRLAEKLNNHEHN